MSTASECSTSATATSATECVLDLVEHGHRLVADDVVQMSKLGNAIIGHASAIIGITWKSAE